ncbi:MAG: flagellar hook-basal body protein [Anaerovoracaceae bacterium]|jgi:flagellar basal-body rod protein FlgF|nr:flagellar hook-basal body complex protein [Clostridiales bacterium]
MVRGYYSAASGVFCQQKALDAISNNIANITTAGYKSQSTLESSFGEHLVARLSSLDNISSRDIGSGAFITVNSTQYTDFTQGSFEDTGRSVDMAISGEGFFLIESETYGSVLTRNGQFEIDEDGDLYLPGVGKVLDDDEDTINLESSEFIVSTTGTIIVDNDEIGELFIAIPNEDARVKSVGNGVFLCEHGNYEQADPENYSVLQGLIEKPNVNIAKEMSKIIAGQNLYTSCTQILKIYDSINEITVNQIGRVG